MDDATLNDALRRSYLIDTLDSPSASDTSPNGGALQSRFTLDTVVEDEGSNLSVGQRSLVSLARALAKDAKVVVLDEVCCSPSFSVIPWVGWTSFADLKF
jgi:ABC-type multidrug transport system fused ATPase/permease subunit